MDVCLEVCPPSLQNLVCFSVKNGGDFAAALRIQFLTWCVAADRGRLSGARRVAGLRLLMSDQVFQSGMLPRFVDALGRKAGADFRRRVCMYSGRVECVSLAACLWRVVVNMAWWPGARRWQRI